MAKCIYWTDKSYNEFLAKSGNLLSKRQKQIIDMRLNEFTVREMAAKLDVSEPTIHKDIEKIKKVYSMLYKNSDEMYPIFKNSKELNDYIKKL